MNEASHKQAVGDHFAAKPTVNSVFPALWRVSVRAVLAVFLAGLAMPAAAEEVTTQLFSGTLTVQEGSLPGSPGTNRWGWDNGRYGTISSKTVTTVYGVDLTLGSINWESPAGLTPLYLSFDAGSNSDITAGLRWAKLKLVGPLQSHERGFSLAVWTSVTKTYQFAGFAGHDEGSLVEVTITDHNHRPVAHAGSNETVDEGDLVTLDGSLSSDANEVTVTVQNVSATIAASLGVLPGVAKNQIAEDGADHTFTVSVTSAPVVPGADIPVPWSAIGSGTNAAEVGDFTAVGGTLTSNRPTSSIATAP